MLDEPIKWPNQFAHLLFSTSILLARVVWFPKNDLASFILFLALISYAAIKEFVWDVFVEKSQGEGGAAVDYAFYLIGALATELALHLTHKL